MRGNEKKIVALIEARIRALRSEYDSAKLKKSEATRTMAELLDLLDDIRKVKKNT